MLTTTFEHVSQFVADVTPEEIGRCHKVFHDGHAFYAVENERGERDDDGAIKEYTVKYDPQTGYTCTCPNGKIGFNVKHASNVCKHCRWACAAELEEQAYSRDIAAKQAEEEAARIEAEPGSRQHYLEIDGKEASPRDYARVMNAQPYPWTEEEIKRDQGLNDSRTFKFLR